MAVRGRTRLVLWLVLALGAYAAWRFGVPYFFGGAAGTERLTNQVWLERMPRDQRDIVRHFFLIDDKGNRIGSVGRASRWRIHTEMFLWGLDRDLLRTRFPQDGTLARFRVRTWKCAGDAPRPFDWCLEVSNDRRTLRFYSRDGWKIRPHEAALEEGAQGELGFLAPALRVGTPPPGDGPGSGEEVSGRAFPLDEGPVAPAAAP
jgi:hypothetical protein